MGNGLKQQDSQFIRTTVDPSASAFVSQSTTRTSLYKSAVTSASNATIHLGLDAETFFSEVLPHLQKSS